VQLISSYYTGTELYVPMHSCTHPERFDTW